MIRTIHQFTPSMEVGDSVSNAVLYIQKMLHKLGFISEIYVARLDLDRNFKHNIHHITEYKESEENLLFYHHSIGHDSHQMIMDFIDKKIIIYHNITPPHFFKHNPHIQKLCIQGRKQLAVSAEYFIASIGDSDYNVKELKSFNYPNPKTLTLLLDFDRQNKTKPNKKLIQKYYDTYNIIFVGRVVQNKVQHQLVDVAYALKRKGVKNFKIHIIGGASEPNYMKFLQEYVKDMDMLVEVIITGKVSDEDLIAYYHIADLYLSLSEHEGFGMPLIEAMKYDIPVLAYNAGGTTTTIPKEGLLEKKSPSFIADEIIKLQNDPYFRVDLVKKQKDKLESFSTTNTINNLADFLNSLDLDLGKISKIKQKQKNKKDLDIQVEGPFDSSYSLAIVNKNIALCLDAKLYSTEGGGDFEANLDNVDTKVRELALKELDNIDVTIRNLYPPRTNDMRGYHKIIGPYGWEESKFPKQYVEWFNTKLTMVFTMSDYVKNLLEENGVDLPIVTTGLVVEDILKIKSKPLPYNLPDAFKMLHISSAFARKGVDILLEAFEKLDDKNKISLIIKTFPNPHNDVINQIENLKYTIKDSYEDGVSLYKKSNKEILLINKDISDSEIKYLYEKADILVAPSYGEGFGLPMAEAMLLNLPVITTNYGGQVDFCSDDNSWLLDFEFRYAKTHMNLKNSIWAVPKVESLIEKITELRVMLSSARTNKVLKDKLKKAKQRVLKQYSSKQVSKNILDALNSYEKPSVKNNIALFSTYNTRCGIAIYAKYLISSFKDEVVVFANKTDNTTQKDEKNIIRCWEESRDTKEIQELKQQLLDKNITTFIIQYNFSFIPLNLLSELLVFCDKNGIKTYLFLHSTQDVVTKDYTDSFSFISDELKSVTKIYVHTLKDLNYLKEFGIYKNTVLFTHGLNYDAKNLPSVISNNETSDIKTLATFGFLLPQKGVFELVELVEALHKAGKKVKLLLLTSIHPAPISKELEIKLKQKINASSVKEYITLQTDFLLEDEIISKLSQTDKILFLYSNTQESSSAAVRMGLLAQKEVITTPLDIFDDVKDIVTQTKDNSLDEILKTVKFSLDKPYDVKKHKRFLEENSWDVISDTFKRSIK